MILSFLLRFLLVKQEARTEKGTITMTTLGATTMSVDPRYESIFLKGRPQHEKFSDFWCRHIPMDPGHRAKIFSSFDALKGFDEEIEKKQVLYVNQIKLDKDRREELDRKLSAAENRSATVSYFVPCDDVNNDAFDEGKGRYKNVSGIVAKVNPITETLEIDGQVICFEDISRLEWNN